MRISIVGSRGFPSTYGGFEAFVRVLAPYLAARGHEVVVYARGKNRRHRRGRIDNVDVIDTFGIETKSLSTLSFGLAATLDSAVRAPEAALVLNVANGYFLPLLRARGIPTLLNVDGIEWERAKWNRAGKAVFRTGAALSARLASELVADSKAIARVWRDELGRQPIFIPYGAPDNTGVGIRRIERLGLNPKSYVLVVARLVPENNVELAVSAYEASQVDLPLVIVGSSGRRPSDQDVAASATSGHCVRWLGHVHDQDLLAELWANATVYIHGHSVGGTNPALLQALAYGAPVLAYDSPYNEEVLSSREQLYASAAELRDKLGVATRDPSVARRFSEYGRRRVATDYRWDDVCASYEAVLNAIATHSSGRAERSVRRIVTSPSK